jgi:spore maturation protein CgeB
MRIVLFCHSLVSCWGHRSAHFLRGVATELAVRGHGVRAFEPADGWSRRHLVEEHGPEAQGAFRRDFPRLSPATYRVDRFDPDAALDGADLVLVHEWTDPAIVARIGRHRRAGGRYRLLFHDTHHRAATDPGAMAALPLGDYDGVLACGESLRDRYVTMGWASRVWTWHEAADARVFQPRPATADDGHLVWIGSWGDEARAAELGEFLLEPVSVLGLRATVHGVRYPAEARAALARAGCRYAGWLPNARVPEVFANHRVTVHVPRRAHAAALPGIPTIRPFEAMACGIPLVSAPWDDVEGLFRPGIDYLVARNGREMKKCLAAVLLDQGLAKELARHGRETIRARHTCAHRVDELLAIDAGLRSQLAAGAAPDQSRGAA